MNAEEGYFIYTKIILFSPDAKYPMTHPCGAWAEENENVIRSIRYCIYGPDRFGRPEAKFLPQRIYESAIETDCYGFKYHVAKTNKYKKEIDSWAFKYYDDADEVLENIKSYILWAKNNQTKKIATITAMTIKNFNPSPEWLEMKALSIGLKEKKIRNNLSSFQKMIAEEQDLIEAQSR